MGKPAARMTDLTKYGGPIVQGSATVLIGDAGGKACSICPGGMAVGSPVNPALGAKVLTGGDELDFALPGPMPLVWQRQYSSYVNAEQGAPCGLLGYGWKLWVEVSLQLLQDSALMFDASGRTITFEGPLAPGQAKFCASESLWLLRGGGVPAAPAGTRQDTRPARTASDHLPWSLQPYWSHVPAALAGNPDCVLVAGGSARTVWVMLPSAQGHHRLGGLIDQFGRSQHFHRGENGRLDGITDGAGRRYALLYNQPPGKADAAQGPAAFASPLLQPDSGLRLVGVDCVHNPHDPQQAGLSPGSAKPTALVRYKYSALGDLVEVVGRDGQCTRQFAYDAAHRMVAHRLRGGPAHSYVYEDQAPQRQSARAPLRPGARVAEQHNEEGLSYFFDYAEFKDSTPERSQVTVRDSLNRTVEYHFEGAGGLKRLVRQVRSDGSQTQHQYDGSGRRVATTDALGRTSRWRYDGLGRLLGIQLPDGRSSSQRWGEIGSAQDGLVLQSTSASGVKTSFDHDHLGRLIRMAEADGGEHCAETRFEYASAPPGQAFSPSVLPWCDQPVAVVDAQGGRKTLGYDACGQLSSYADCSGRTSRWRYDPWGGLVEEADALDQRVRHHRDPSGQLVKTERADGSTIQYRYGPNGEVQALSLGAMWASSGSPAPKSATVAFAHDLWGRVVRQEQNGQSVGMRYDVAGRLVELVNENNAVTRFAYDSRDRLVQEVGFDGRSQVYRYDLAGQLIEKIDGDSDTHGDVAAAASNLRQTVRSRYHYDDGSRLVARVTGKHAALEVHQFSYDAAGQLVQARNWTFSAQTQAPHDKAEPADASVIAAWFDASRAELDSVLRDPHGESVAALAGRLQAHRLQASSQVQFQQDALGRTTFEKQTLFAQRDGKERTGAQGEPPVEFEHQISHRLGPLGRRQSSSLHGMGQLEWLSYGAGHVHGLLLDQTPLLSFERDGLHREVGRTLHLVPSQGGRHQVDGPPQAAEAITLSLQLDPLGRLLDQRWHGLNLGARQGAASRPATPDGATGQPLVGGAQSGLARLARRNYAYDALGQLTGVNTPADATLYEYDAMQRLTGAQVTSHQGQSGQHWRTDAAGNRLPGRLDAGRAWPGAAADWSTKVKQNLHDAEFNLLTPEGGGQASSGELVRWPSNRVGYCDEANGAQKLYAYDIHGNRVQAQRSDGQRLAMHYDALHQLQASEQFDGQGQLQGLTLYRYDAFGRRLSKVHHGIGQERARATYFGWDGDRLVHSEDGESVRHTVYEPEKFTPLLQLHRAKGALNATEALWSLAMGEDDVAAPGGGADFQGMARGQQALLKDALTDAISQPGGKGPASPSYDAEIGDASGGPLSLLRQAHQRSQEEHPVIARHYLCDHLGTPIALVDANGREAGTVTWAAVYGAWGDVQSEYNPHGIDQPVRFQGQHLDRETDLHYNRFRYYDPATGSYTSQDPIGLRGGLNKYTYVKGRATQLSDPLGLADNTSPWQLGQEWLTGTGPKHHDFTDGDPFAELLKGHKNVQNLLKAACSGKMANGKPLPNKGKWDYSVGGNDGALLYLQDYSNILTGGRTGNLAVTFLGSYNATFGISNNVLTVVAENSSTIQSATHPPIVGYTKWWEDNIGNPLNNYFKSGPMSEKTQTITMTFNLACDCK